jgi:hypothetical protein
MSEFWGRVEQLEGQRLETAQQRKPFLVARVGREQVQILPESGKRVLRSIRRDPIEQIARLQLPAEELRRRAAEEFPSSRVTSYLAAIVLAAGGVVLESDSDSTAPASSGSLTRLDTRLESEGAEFLVLGQLLLARIAAYKTYTNMPGYDLVATDPERGSSARIQVKSRWRTGAPGFPIRNFACDFVVFARLNRGSKDGRSAAKAPEYFVFPREVVEQAPRSANWSKVLIKDIPDVDGYRDRWDLVREFLRGRVPIRNA